MFGSKKTPNNSSSTQVQVQIGGTNSLVAGTVVEGSIVTNTDIRIDGTLKGNLKCNGKVIIGPEGRVLGEIVCTNAAFEGFFEGKLKVENTLQIKETAVVTGEVDTANLVVQAGAKFNATCTTDKGNPKQLIAPSEKKTLA
jgi:cytoskeletal protein CcmA (bactofilin family)